MLINPSGFNSAATWLRHIAPYSNFRWATVFRRAFHPQPPESVITHIPDWITSASKSRLSRYGRPVCSNYNHESSSIFHPKPPTHRLTTQPTKPRQKPAAHPTQEVIEFPDIPDESPPFDRIPLPLVCNCDTLQCLPCSPIRTCPPSSPEPCPIHHHDDPEIQQRLSILTTGAHTTPTITSMGDMRCSTINTNSLTEDKLQDIITLVHIHQIDIMFITDTRCNAPESKWLQRRAQALLGPSATVLIAPTLSTSQIKVGGQMVLIREKWGLPTPKFWKDPSDLGLITSISLNAGSVHLLLIGTYPAYNQSR
jgi:hypothetical protein